MKLRALDAEFVQWVDDSSTRRSTSEHEITLANADGIMFQCPLCYSKNEGPFGTHYVMCWFVGKVPDSARPGPGRWTPKGSGLDDLTFVPGKPPRSVSVHLTGAGCGWHGYVKNGEAA